MNRICRHDHNKCPSIHTGGTWNGSWKMHTTCVPRCKKKLLFAVSINSHISIEHDCLHKRAFPLPPNFLHKSTFCPFFRHLLFHDSAFVRNRREKMPAGDSEEMIRKWRRRFSYSRFQIFTTPSLSLALRVADKSASPSIHFRCLEKCE